MLKVFLVDDEIVIREGIRNSFPWESSGYTLVGEAPDGELALPMIRDENPDILITDIRMPFMDGMQLCREVHRIMPRISIIILSGYDDFSYAQQAISLGVQEYLLKPVSSSDLKAALDRVAERMIEDRRARERMDSMRRRVTTGSRFVRERLLSTLFSEDLSDSDARETIEQMRALGINLLANCYVVLDAAFTAPDRTAACDALWQLAEPFGGIVHICPSRHGARMLVLGDNERDAEERSYAFAQSAVRELDSVGASDVLISIGACSPDFPGITRSKESARHTRHVAVARRKEGFTARIVGAKEAQSLSACSLPPDVRPLHERLQYISESEADSAFSGYVAELSSAALNLGVAMDYLRVEAILTATRIIRESGCDPEAVLPSGWQECALRADDPDDLSASLNLLRTALRCRDENDPSRCNPSIARARSYLSRHFSDPGLMLQDVANEVGMSSSRFSTVFSQETGYTFTEYLAQLRLGKAKELLLATDRRSSQIAADIGYSDPHYFSYLFKKTTGMTPSEFRRQSKESG